MRSSAEQLSLSLIDPVINSKGSSLPRNKVKPLGSVYIPYVKGVSEKFQLKGTGIILGHPAEFMMEVKI
jgi:hypothetical protein